MKSDKAKVTLTRISKFGLMQISRQKLGPPIQLGSYTVCPHCDGRGIIRSVETLSLYYLRQIQTRIANRKIEKVACALPLNVAQYLLNKKRKELLDLEQQYEVQILIEADPTLLPSQNRIEYLKRESNGGAQPEGAAAGSSPGTR